MGIYEWKGRGFMNGQFAGLCMGGFLERVFGALRSGIQRGSGTVVLKVYEWAFHEFMNGRFMNLSMGVLWIYEWTGLCMGLR